MAAVRGKKKSPAKRKLQSLSGEMSDICVQQFVQWKCAKVDSETFEAFVSVHCNPSRGLTAEKFRLFFKNLRWVHTTKFLPAKKREK